MFGFLIRNNFKNNWLLYLVIVIGFILRVIGVEFGKPFRYHPDEMKLVWQAGHLLDYHSWSKETLFLIGVYPPFFTYVLAIAFALYRLLMVIIGQFPSIAAIKEIYYVYPFQFHLIGRWISILAGTATIPLLYWVGKKLYGKLTGLLSAAFLAVIFFHVRTSHFATVDVFVTFLTMVSFAFSVAILEKNDVKYYIGAGVFAGLAAATKFNAGIVVLPLIISHFFSYFSNSTVDWKTFFLKIVIAGVVTLAVFLIACPMPLLDFKEFWGGIVGTVRFESIGKLGSGGSFWSYFTGDQSPGYGFFHFNTLPKGLGWPIVLLFCIGTIILLIRHKKQDFVILVFPIVLYLLVGRLNYKALRHLMMAIPFFLIISAETLRILTHKFDKRAGLPIAIILFGIGIVIPQIQKSLSYDLAMQETDTRTIAKDWIESNIPAGAKIGVDEFSPPLLSRLDLNLKLISKSPYYRHVYDEYGLVPRMFAHGKQRTADHNPTEYILNNGIEYLVLDSFSRAKYRWKYTVKKYPKVANDRKMFYRWVKENCELLRRFRPQNQFDIHPEIEIYRVRR